MYLIKVVELVLFLLTDLIWIYCILLLIRGKK